MKPIYLDYNATTPIALEVQQAILPFLSEHFGNPSSSHALGRSPRAAVEDARKHIATLIGASADEVFFTSGGTESNNLAIQGTLLAHAPGDGHFVISAIEHPATVEPAKYLESLGFSVSVVPVSRDGVVRPEDVEAALRPQTRLVSIMHANNEIGTLQPIRAIAELCKARGIRLHTDAAQSVGKVPTLVDALGADLMSIAGHKLYAPKGIGAIYIRRGASLVRLLHGAGQEHGVRPGTENVPFIVGLGAAAELAGSRLGESQNRMSRLRDRLLRQLREAIGEGLTVNGESAERLPNTLSANFPGVTASELLQRVPEVCASTGAACHSGATKLSVTLAGIGLAPEIARGTVRLSVGWYTTEEEIDRAAAALIAAWG